MGDSSQRLATAAFSPGKRPGTHCKGGWVGPKAGLEGWEKFRPKMEFDPRTIQPVVGGYNDWAIENLASNEQA